MTDQQPDRPRGRRPYPRGSGADRTGTGRGTGLRPDQQGKGSRRTGADPRGRFGPDSRARSGGGPEGRDRSGGGAPEGRGRPANGVPAPAGAGDRRRVWGQNFFRSADAVRRFAGQIDPVEGLPTVEVGPGSGMITKILAESGLPLTVVEIDDHWAGRLAEQLPAHVRVVNQDFLQWRPETDVFRVVGNLPFGASTDILRACLGHGPDRFAEGVLLLQREFALKRAGHWGGNLFNAQWSPWFTFRVGLEFPRQCFRPVPKTDTATLFTDARREDLVPWADRAAYQDLVSAVFNTGHLTVGDAARGAGARGTSAWLRKAGVRPEARVKDLSADDWAALFHTFEAKRSRPAGRPGPRGRGGYGGGHGGHGGGPRRGGPRNRPRR